MNNSDLKHQNAVDIYRCILNGIDNISAISAEVGVSLLTVSSLAREFISREIIDISKPRRNVTGRRVHRYSPSHKYFCYFIDMQDEYFSTISINTGGNVLDRFDFPLNYEKRTCQDVFDNFVLKRIKENDNYKFCTAIFLLGDNIDNLSIDKDIIKTTKEELIADALIKADKTIFFNFNDKYIMSLYSHVSFPKVDKATVFKVINFDDVYEFTGDLYFEAFNAMQIMSKKKLEEYI